MNVAIADTDTVLDALMRALAAQKASDAHFVERRFSAMLTEPLKSSGTLMYRAPDKLEKITLFPQLQRLSVNGDRVVIDPSLSGGSKAISMESRPEIGALVEAIRGTLAGDLPALRRFYSVSLDGTLSDWTLHLEPTADTVRRLVSSIDVKGKRAEIEVLEIRETDGDRTEMIILEDSK